jgi:cytochrome c oxidase assembly factor CtaG
MIEHILLHMALTLVLAPALAAGATGRLRIAPVPALVQFGALLVILHLPRVWDTLQQQRLLALLAAALTLASAVLFWWPALAPASPLGPVGRIGYLMVGMPVMSAVGVVLDFVHHPLYRGVTLSEQHRAGALMWGVGSAVAAAILVVGVWVALVREERALTGAGAR